MGRITNLPHRFRHKFPNLAMLIARHPVWASGTAVLLVAVIVVARIVLPPLFAACGEGLSTDDDGACIGVNLASQPFTPTEPDRMRTLEAQLRADNDAVTQNYVSVVLLEDMSPNPKVDTRNYTDLYPDIEGALAAAWRANHTAAFQGRLPKVKLFLGNMGSQYASWSEAVDHIMDSATANHIVSVIGLGQSMGNTRAAAAKLTGQAHLPVIGGALTGDTMNLDPDGQLNPGFFRASPTNTDTVLAATRYIESIQPDQSRVAIVQDNIPGDDYTQTLGAVAVKDMPTAHRFPFTSPGPQPTDVSRSDPLSTQFAFLDENLCSVSPSVVYFAGRGVDLGPFVQSWTQGNTPCANGQLTVVTGDDGGAALSEASLRDAVRGGHVRVMVTELASPDEWGPCSMTSADQAAYNTFQAVFTGKPDRCGNQPVRADDGAAPLGFDLADLNTGEGILTHDGMMVAVTAARRAAGGNADTVVRAPMSQIGFIEEMRCGNAVPGASGAIEFSPDQAQYGNPVDKPIPIVEIHGDGSTATVWNKAVTPGVTQASC